MPDQPAHPAPSPAGESPDDHVAAIPCSAVVIDDAGIIVAANAPWRRFAAANGGRARTTGVGADYLAACRGAPEAAVVLQALTDLRRGCTDAITHDYPCHAPHLPRWFRLHGRRVAPGASLLVHQPITDLVNVARGRRLLRDAEDRGLGRAHAWFELLDGADASSALAPVRARVVSHEGAVLDELVAALRADETLTARRSLPVAGGDVHHLVDVVVRRVDGRVRGTALGRVDLDELLRRRPDLALAADARLGLVSTALMHAHVRRALDDPRRTAVVLALEVHPDLELLREAHGDDVATEVMRVVAGRVVVAADDETLVARAGVSGLVALPATGLVDAIEASGRRLAAAADGMPVVLSDTTVDVEVRTGLAVAGPHDTAGTLMERARRQAQLAPGRRVRSG